MGLARVSLISPFGSGQQAGDELGDLAGPQAERGQGATTSQWHLSPTCHGSQKLIIANASLSARVSVWFFG